MTADNRKSYRSYLNKWVDQYNNTYHSMNKKPSNTDYSALTENIFFFCIKHLHVKHKKYNHQVYI